jgi:hypothetical protein
VVSGRNSKTADPGLNNYGFTTLVPILLLEQKTRKNATCFSPDVNLEIEIVGSLVGTLGAGHIPGLVVDIVHVALEVVLLSEALVTRVAGEGLPLHLGVATAAAQLVLLHILHRLLALAAHNWLQREKDTLRCTQILVKILEKTVYLTSPPPPFPFLKMMFSTFPPLLGFKFKNSTRKVSTMQCS